MLNKTARVERFINCHGCWSEETCLVEFSYTEGGKICDAKVVGLPRGWEYKPLGDTEAMAPYCLSCLQSEDRD